MAAGKELKRLRGSVSAKDAATLIGVDPERLRKWEQRDADPKDTGDIAALENFFGVPIKELTNLDNFQFVQPKAAAKEDNQTISSLSESNRALSEANRTLADSHKLLADAHDRLVRSNERLIQMLETSYNKQASADPEKVLPAGGTLAAEEELRRTGRTGPYALLKKGEPQGSSGKKGK